MATLNSGDLAAARTLLLAYLANSDNDSIEQYASHNLTQLCDTRRVEDFDSICEVGNNFAENYDFSDEFISGIREKFEEAEELTWKSFEATMDEIIGPFVDQRAISLFLAVINSIQVPAAELDDLLDLAAWFLSVRLSPLVRAEGGWGRFSQNILNPNLAGSQPEITSISFTSAPPDIEKPENELEAVDMGSMIVLQERETEAPVKSSPVPINNSSLRPDDSSPIDDVTPVQSFTADLPTPVQSALYTIDQIDREIRAEEDTVEPEDREKIEAEEQNLAMDSDESSGAFIDQAEVGVPFDLRERHFCSETVSEQSSSERLSSSPVMISPPGTGTPVYINSQPESIDLDSNSSSLDASLINDLIENLKVDGVPSALPESFGRDSENDSENLAPPELEISDDQIRESLDEADSELAFNRSNTVETIKPVNSAIPIRPSSSKQLDITDDYSPLRNSQSFLESTPEESSHEGIRLIGHPQETIPSKEIENKIQPLEKSNNDSELNIDRNEENTSRPNYLLIFGAAAISVAAIYLKTSR